jgi:rRNA maturation endonuclease Nob1
MPTNIDWDAGTAKINILCDGCDKEYSIVTQDIEGLELCPFCGHYLESIIENINYDESEEDSWD